MVVLQLLFEFHQTIWQRIHQQLIVIIRLTTLTFDTWN